MSRIKKVDSHYQMELVEKLRAGVISYEDAPIYTILLDMVSTNGIEEVFSTLHSLSSDLNQRDKLESMSAKSFSWQWDNK